MFVYFFSMIYNDIINTIFNNPVIQFQFQVQNEYHYEVLFFQNNLHYIPNLINQIGTYHTIQAVFLVPIHNIQVTVSAKV